ncbi:MAG: hypothetical protein IKT54_06385 [Clostridia bacterium]|nr:hypothetical protein [Clostridia bacterium]
MKRLLFVVFLILFLACGTSVNAYLSPNDALKEIEDSIPDGVKQDIPSDAVESADAKAIIDVGVKSILDAVNPSIKALASIVGVIIISAMLNVLRTSIADNSYAPLFETASALVLTLTVYDIVKDVLNAAFSAIENLSLFMNGMIPVMTGLYLSSGEIASAAASHSGMLMTLNLLENAIRYLFYPILRISIGASVASCVSKSELSAISNFLRGFYTTALTFVMAILTFVLSAQSSLAQGADSMTVRTVRFVAGSFVPVVGGALSEAVRTVFGSFSYIKTTVGWGGIIAILVIILPVIIKLFIVKIVFSASACLSKLLGCQSESGIIEEMNKNMNMIIAALLSMAIMFIFSLTLVIRSALAE